MALQILIERQSHSRRLLYIDASAMQNCPLTGDRFPIMRKAVRVESKRKAILFVGAAGMLRLLTLPVSAAETLWYLNVAGYCATL